MKYFKIISVSLSLLIMTNIVIAQSKRTLANPDVKVEVRSTEDIVQDPDAFVSINPGDNAAKMSSKALRVKNKVVATKKMGLFQSQSNKKDKMKKFNRFSNKQGEKKNEK